MTELKQQGTTTVPVNQLIERVVGQVWPGGSLYVVATPIGNLTDLSLRGWYALAQADVIAAEDTRSTRPLLQAWGVQTPLMAAHRHNEAMAAEQIVQRLAQGERVALVSDAGAPAVSDPGARIVRAVREAGYQVVPIPGASAVITALMGTGATSDENPAFAFAGFVPTKQQARRKWFAQWQSFAGPVLMFESPHRLRASLADLLTVCGPEREVSVARELTKRFEQLHTMPLGEAVAWCDADAHHEQGEFVLVLHAPMVGDTLGEELDATTQAWVQALLTHLSVRDVAKVVSQVTGLSRDAVYQYALAHRDGGV